MNLSDQQCALADQPLCMLGLLAPDCPAAQSVGAWRASRLHAARVVAWHVAKGYGAQLEAAGGFEAQCRVARAWRADLDPVVQAAERLRNAVPASVDVGGMFAWQFAQTPFMVLLHSDAPVPGKSLRVHMIGDSASVPTYESTAASLMCAVARLQIVALSAFVGDDCASTFALCIANLSSARQAAAEFHPPPLAEQRRRAPLIMSPVFIQQFATALLYAAYAAGVVRSLGAGALLHRNQAMNAAACLAEIGALLRTVLDASPPLIVTSGQCYALRSIAVDRSSMAMLIVGATLLDDAKQLTAKAAASPEWAARRLTQLQVARDVHASAAARGASRTLFHDEQSNVQVYIDAIGLAAQVGEARTDVRMDSRSVGQRDRPLNAADIFARIHTPDARLPTVSLAWNAAERMVHVVYDGALK